jgi:iron(III) transport system substrate-binding protein
VKDFVAEGACSAGFTDTDDFFAAKDAGKPVAMHPVRLENGKTIAIPNTVAIIRGTKNISAAQKFVDFLLSEETELALARSKARQVPLGPVPLKQLPEDVRELVEWAKDGIDLTPLGPARAECLAWLKSEYLQ